MNRPNFEKFLVGALDTPIVLIKDGISIHAIPFLVSFMQKSNFDHHFMLSNDPFISAMAQSKSNAVDLYTEYLFTWDSFIKVLEEILEKLKKYPKKSCRLYIYELSPYLEDTLVSQGKCLAFLNLLWRCYKEYQCEFIMFCHEDLLTSYFSSYLEQLFPAVLALSDPSHACSQLSQGSSSKTWNAKFRSFSWTKNKWRSEEILISLTEDTFNIRYLKDLPKDDQDIDHLEDVKNADELMQKLATFNVILTDSQRQAKEALELPYLRAQCNLIFILILFY